MKRFFVAIFLLFAFVWLGYLHSRANAETPTPTPTSTLKPISRCLERVRCNKKFPESSVCAKQSGHRVQLSADHTKAPLRKNQKTYINVCLSYTPPGETIARTVCTTGSTELDMEIHKKDNYSKLVNDVAFKLEAIDLVLKQGPDGSLQPIFPPKPETVMSDGNADIPLLEWQDSTPKGYTRRFMGFQLVDTTKALREKVAGQQQAELDFLEDPQVCAEIVWDPDGRVFDAVTLDPIPGAVVKLLQKRPSGNWVEPAITPRLPPPPFRTLVDGEYAYDVPDGDYKLVVTPPPNYAFPVSDIAKVHPNYKKVYLNPNAFPPSPTPTENPPPSKTRIYPAETGEVIQVRKKPEHADIPLMPSDPQGYEHKEITVNVGVTRKLSGNLVIQGLSSHPFTKINVYVGNADNPNDKTLYKTYQSEYDGTIYLELDQTTFPAGKIYKEVGFVASDLTKEVTQGKKYFARILDLLGYLIGKKEVQAAQETIIKIPQMPSYLEGYAYDAGGKPLANATVGVYLTFSQIPSYETTTDEKGYYRVTSEYLPNMPYTLQYTSATGGVTRVEPEAFIAQNADYLKENNVKLYGYRNTAGKNTPPNFFSGSGAKPTPEGTPQTGANQTPPLVQGTQGGTLTYIILIVLLMIVAGVVVWYFVSKKNKPQDLNQPQS